MIVDRFKEVIGVLFAYVLYAKIIDDEAERDWTPVMLPVAWGDCDFSIAIDV